MSFSRAQVKRFNDIKDCAPPVGAYDPKALEAHASAGFEKSDRFKVPKEVPCPSLSLTSSFNVSTVSSCSSNGALTPSKKLFSTSTPNLLIPPEKKHKHGDTPKPVDASKLKELEKEIKRLFQERADQDKQLAKREEEVKKLDGRLHHALYEKSTLQAKVASLEKQLIDLQKGNDVLKNKMVTSEGAQKKQENLQAEINSLKSQISVKENEATRLRHQMETSVNELLDGLCSSINTASSLTETEQLAGDLADLRANNLGINEKLKLATLKVQILKEEIKCTCSRNCAACEEWEAKYHCVMEKHDQMEMALSRAEENLTSAIACRVAVYQYRDALCGQVAALEPTVTDLRYDQWGYEEHIRHLKGEVFVEADARKSESQTAFESSAEKAEFEEKIYQLEECNEELNSNIRLMTEKYQVLETTQTDEQSLYNGQIETLRAELSVSKQHQGLLETEVEQLEKTSKELMNLLAEQTSCSDKNLSEMRVEVSSGKDRESVQQEEMDALKHQLTQQLNIAQSCKSVIEAEKAELEKVLEEVNVERQIVLDKYLQVENKLEEGEKQIEQLLTEKSDLCAELDKVKEERETFSDVCVQLETKLFDCDWGKQEVLTENLRLAEDLEKVDGESSVFRDTCIQLEECLTQTEHEVENVLTQRAELRRELGNMAHEKETSEEKCLHLEAKLCVSEQENEELTAAYTKLQDDLENSVDIRQSITDKYVELENKMAAVMVEQETAGRVAFEEELLRHQEDCSKLHEEIERLNAELSNMTTEKLELGSEKINLADNLEKLMQEKSLLSEKYELLEGKLEMVLSEKSNVLEVMESTIEERNAINEKLSSMTSDLKELKKTKTETCEELEGRLEMALSEKSDMLEVMQSTIQEGKGMKEKIASLTSDLQRLKKTKTETCELLEIQLEMALSEKSDMLEVLQSTIEERKAISEKLTNLTSDLEELKKSKTETCELLEGRLEMALSEKSDMLEVLHSTIEEGKGMKEKLASLTSDLQRLEKTKTETCELLEGRLEIALSEKSDMLEVLQSTIEERKGMNEKLTSMTSNLKKTESENCELRSEKESLKNKVLVAISERDKLCVKYTELEASLSAQWTEKSEEWRREKVEMERSRDEAIERLGQIERLLRQNERLREEIMARQQQVEADFERLLNEESVRRDQLREQYEQQIEVLHEQLDDSTPNEEIDELRHAVEKWKLQFTELQAKVEPFMEQIDAFEMERQALLGKNKDAQHEVEKLSHDYAKLLGHQNQKQKIKHILKIKDENNTLKIELAKVREQSSKSKRTIQRLENKILTLEGHQGKFDPSKAFQHSKENELGAKTPHYKHDNLDTSRRAYPMRGVSPLATRNSKYSSPIRDGLGNRL